MRCTGRRRRPGHAAASTPTAAVVRRHRSGTVTVLVRGGAGGGRGRVTVLTDVLIEVTVVGGGGESVVGSQAGRSSGPGSRWPPPPGRSPRRRPRRWPAGSATWTGRRVRRVVVHAVGVRHRRRSCAQRGIVLRILSHSVSLGFSFISTRRTCRQSPPCGRSPASFFIRSFLSSSSGKSDIPRRVGRTARRQPGC